MGFAYTPGLAVSPRTVIHKVRRLPLKGRVLVQKGDAVKADTVVAETNLPGEVRPLNAVGILGVSADELRSVMLKKEGQAVAAGETIAVRKSFFGLFSNELKAPIDGAIEAISAVTGQVIVRGKPIALQRLAYVDGVVVDILPDEAVTLEVRGTFVQGIFGVGGEATGPLELVVSRPDERLDVKHLRPEHSGKVLIGGGRVTAAAVQRAAELGVHGLIVGGLDDADLREFLGYELGVAITGEETIGVTIVVTEGFGDIAMAPATFELLKSRVGLLASVNGATQIRAGVIRPEVLIPLEADAPAESAGERDSILEIGTAVRAIRQPYFGRIGRCVGLPVELATLASETRVRVLEVELEDGTRATLPRANVELIKN